jgi:predicted transcriptional regulator
MSNSNHASQPAVTLSIRVPLEARDQLEELANATGRTKSFLAAEAIEYYLSVQSWQLAAIEKTIKKIDSKKTKFFSHEDISNWLNSWGTEEEQDIPE